MSNYFSKFPKIYYSFDGYKSLLNVTNITSRFALENKLKDNTSVYYMYEVKDGDTPEIIAHKIYGSVERHWLILAMNDIVDPLFDWPMSYDTLIRFIDEKYKVYANSSVTGEGVAWSRENTHSYYRVESTTLPGGIVNVDKYEIDVNTYIELESISNKTVVLPDGVTVILDTTKESKTYYEYEYDSNEEKRKIKIIRPDIVPALEEEFRKVFL